jgi:hypothetical protein
VEARGVKFGNGVYTVEFEQVERHLEFGHKYSFCCVICVFNASLTDAIDDCPEYVINSPDWPKRRD